MKCPHDGNELASRHYESDIEVDQCGACSGVWLDRGELERIQETVERDYRQELEAVPQSTVQAYRNARSEHDREDLECPSCGSEMTEREHGYCSQILIDICTECRGVWLDAGELEALEVFFERSQADSGELRQGFWRSLRDVFGAFVPD